MSEFANAQYLKPLPPQLHLTSYFWKFCMSHLPFGIVLLSLCVYVCQNLQMYINIYTRDKCVCRQANLYLMGNLFVIHHLLIVDAITKADVFAWLHLFFFQWWMGGVVSRGFANFSPNLFYCLLLFMYFPKMNPNYFYNAFNNWNHKQFNQYLHLVVLLLFFSFKSFFFSFALGFCQL